MLRQWQTAQVDSKTALRVSKSLDLTPVTSKLLTARGLTRLKDIRTWLEPDLANLHRPKRLKGVGPAAKLILKHIESGDRVCVHGDFDVDGITSAALLATVLRELGALVTVIVPDRFKDGYGLSETAVRAAAKKETKLLIAVDCGITNQAEIALSAELGMKSIIVDHHEPPEELPRATVIVNPLQPGCNYPFKHLAAVGLAFKLAQALGELAGKERLALDQLDLVALGTVADLVPLVGENRVLVHYGLKEIDRGRRLGVVKLRQACRLEGTPFQATQISFGLAPRLNAAGRLGSAKTSLRLLLSADPVETGKLVAEVESQNRRRQQLDQQIFKEATDMLDSKRVANTIVLSSPDWHEGVKGIVASRIVERFFRPTILFSERDGLCVGSGRSIPGFNIYTAVSSCDDILIKWGGHQGAAGLTLEKKALPEFKRRFEAYAAERLSEEDFVNHLPIDLDLDPEEIEERLVDELDKMAPFGAGNPTPVFSLKNICAEDHKLLGPDERHLKFLAQAGNFVGEAIAFRIDDGVKSLLNQRLNPVDLALELNQNHFRGKRTLQLKVIDAKIGSPSVCSDDKKALINLPGSGTSFFLPKQSRKPEELANVRFVDQRRHDNRDDLLERLIKVGLPAVVYVRDEFEGVKLANSLSRLNGDLSADISVACAASDVTRESNRLVFYQAPLSAGAMRDLCASANGGSMKKLVYLLYDDADLSSAEQTIEALFPKRERLAEIYRLLREHGPFNVDEAAGLCRQELGDDIYQPATRHLAALAIKVLAELELIGKDEDGKLVVRNFDTKVELEKSSSWSRARQLRSEFNEFAKMALTAEPGRLLSVERSLEG